MSFHPQVSFKLEASRDSTWPSLSRYIFQALKHDAILMNSQVQNFVRQLTPSHFSPFSALKNTTCSKQTSPKQSLLQLCSPHSLSIAKTLISQLYRSVSRYYIYFFSFQTWIHWSEHVWYFGGSDVHRMYSRVLKACRPTKNHLGISGDWLLSDCMIVTSDFLLGISIYCASVFSHPKLVHQQIPIALLQSMQNQVTIHCVCHNNLVQTDTPWPPGFSCPYMDFLLVTSGSHLFTTSLGVLIPLKLLVTVLLLWPPPLCSSLDSCS